MTAAAIDTEYAKITGKEKNDVLSEALDMTFNLKPKSAILSLAVVVKVNGTLGNPSCELDELSILRELEGVVPGFGFPPALYWLGRTGCRGDNPCLKPAAAKGGSKQAPAKKEASDPITNGDGGGKPLKGLFGR